MSKYTEIVIITIGHNLIISLFRAQKQKPRAHKGVYNDSADVPAVFTVCAIHGKMHMGKLLFDKNYRGIIWRHCKGTQVPV